MKKIITGLLVIAPIALTANPSLAQKSANTAASIATVNGKAIARSLFEQTVQANIAQGQTDTPELRQIIVEELINRELIAQDAIKNKLDKTDEGQRRLNQARQAVLVDLAIGEHFAKNPITEADLKAEYRRQIELLGGMGPLQQYQLRLAVLPSESQARDMIQKVRAGESFEKLAREQSLDPSRENGGLLDWLLPNQILPSISNVIVNLGKGAVSAAPIQTPAGWNVVQVQDTRPFTPPSYESSLDQLRASLIQQRRAAYLTQLRGSAKITR